MNYAMWRKHYIGWLVWARCGGLDRHLIVKAQDALIRLRYHHGPAPF